VADDGGVSIAEESSQATAPVCWCCGHQFDERELVRLGSHPEVGVCLGCARDLQRRATEREDELRPTRPARLRGVIRSGRARVIDLGWHNKPVLGRLLRRIDRHLP
jgi:hypothetical protein